MSFSRHNPISRAVIAGLMLFARFIATNHCALGLMENSSAANVQHSKCCNGSQDPTKDQPVPGGVRECCKSIHAVPAPDAKLPVNPGNAFSVVDASAIFAALDAQTAAPKSLAAPHEHDPPRAASFAELVLHRSLRSHAPPLAA